jgi:hypothetical protein
MQHAFFTILLYDAEQSGGAVNSGQPVAEDGGTA